MIERSEEPEQNVGGGEKNAPPFIGPNSYQQRSVEGLKQGFGEGM